MGPSSSTSSECACGAWQVPAVFTVQSINVIRQHSLQCIPHLSREERDRVSALAPRINPRLGEGRGIDHVFTVRR